MAERTDLPDPLRVFFAGPFEHHDVVVGGRQVPFLRASVLDGGRVHLNLDRRLGLTLTTEEAERVVPFLADAIAVALGYTSHPAQPETDEPIARHPFPTVEPLEISEDGAAT